MTDREQISPSGFLFGMPFTVNENIPKEAIVDDEGTLGPAMFIIDGVLHIHPEYLEAIRALREEE